MKNNNEFKDIILIEKCAELIVKEYLINNNFRLGVNDCVNINEKLNDVYLTRKLNKYISKININVDSNHEVIIVCIDFKGEYFSKELKYKYVIWRIKYAYETNYKFNLLDDIIIENDGKVRFTGELITPIEYTSQKAFCYRGYDNKEESNEYDVKVYYEGEMLNGLPQGNGRLMWEDGILLFEGEFKFGKIIGYGQSYFCNGNVSSEGYWFDGIPHGEFTQYYENGQIQFKGIMKDGAEIVGESFYNDGRIHYKGKYAKDGYAIEGLIHYLSDDIGYKFNDKGIYIVDTNGNIKRKLNENQFKAFKELYKHKKAC
jgi:antitoxin component YwqK of YwqJK toxin-antitoxin module